MKTFIKDVNIVEGPIDEVFNIDSLKHDYVPGISIKEIWSIYDNIPAQIELNTTYIEVEVCRYMMESIGVTENTPVGEVAALSYLLLFTNSFGFEVISQFVIKGAHTNNLCKLAIEKGVSIPKTVITQCKNAINNTSLFDSIMTANDIRVESNSPTISIDEFLTSLTGSDDLIEILKNLDINLN